MENWKRVLLGGSAGLSVALLLRGHRTGAVVLGGVALATLASEYPEEFAVMRARLPYYFERTATFFDVVSRAGERMAEMTDHRGPAWYETLLSGRME